MNVLFFCHADFSSNSMGHIAGFAAGLARRGHACAAAIPGDVRDSAAALGDHPPLRPVLFSDTWERTGEIFPDGRPADVLHAWTPREHVRRALERCQVAMPAARAAIHLEDNEQFLAERFSGEPYARLRRHSDAEILEKLPQTLAHPRPSQRFLRAAHGVTAIIRPLRKFVPLGTPFAELWPGVDFGRNRPGPADPALRASLGLRPQERVLCYPGNSHFANLEELQTLYEAVFLLNREGVPCRLLRTGADTVPDFAARFDPALLAAHVLHLGWVDAARLPDLLRLADALVQPGRADAFNRYRLPSKLPEFLASGRPVVLPRANVAHRMVDGRDGLFLETGTPQEIAARCRQIFVDPALAERLATGAAAFARRHFDADANAGTLEDFYRRLRRPWRSLLPFLNR